MNVFSILLTPIRFILTLLFIISLSIFILSWIFADFTQYEYLKPLISDIFLKQINSQIDQKYINKIKQNIADYCQLNNTDIIENFAGVNYTIKCNEINETTNMIEYMSVKIFDSFYYKKYECDFITCFNSIDMEERFFLFISEKTHLFLKNLQFKFIIITIISGIVLFLIKHDKLSNRIRSFGVIFLIVGLPGLFIYSISEPLKYQTLPEESVEIISPLIDSMLLAIKDKFNIILLIGVALVIFSFILWFIERRR